MPQLSFPISPDGLVVSALVGLSQTAMADLVQAGKPVPRPLQVRALFDTGCDLTALTPQVVAALGLTPARQAKTQTAAGTQYVNVHKISLGIYPPAGGSGTPYLRPEFEVSGLVASLPFDVLIGMDILREMLLILNGPDQQFTLAF